jgi:hypothetical protein
MDSLLDGELNTHRDDRMVASPPPMAKKKCAPRGVLARKGTEDGPLEIILPEDSLGTKLCQQVFDAGTGIVHGEEIPREVSSSISQFLAIGSVCLQKRTV